MHMHWFFFRLMSSWLKRLTLSADWWHSSDSFILKIPYAGVGYKDSMQSPVNLQCTLAWLASRAAPNACLLQNVLNILGIL